MMAALLQSSFLLSTTDWCGGGSTAFVAARLVSTPPLHDATRASAYCTCSTVGVLATVVQYTSSWHHSSHSPSDTNPGVRYCRSYYAVRIIGRD
jgi:hypothetical protein